MASAIPFDLGLFGKICTFLNPAYLLKSARMVVLKALSATMSTGNEKMLNTWSKRRRITSSEVVETQGIAIVHLVNASTTISRYSKLGSPDGTNLLWSMWMV